MLGDCIFRGACSVCIGLWLGPEKYFLISLCVCLLVQQCFILTVQACVWFVLRLAAETVES
jgi:hypothetical protein